MAVTQLSSMACSYVIAISRYFKGGSAGATAQQALPPDAAVRPKIKAILKATFGPIVISI